ncbi:hypothetical protein ACH4UR_33805 [Streptomyces lydicus]|uniref:hypothetical protein n=1 Tax=Streptomyces lydicus TaxID=47763 RepID=UPI0037A80E08
MEFPYGQDPGAPVRSGIPEHGRIPKYYAAKVEIAALLAELGEVQRQVSAVGGGFPSRKDIKPTDPHATALAALMKGVDIFHPDWQDIDKNLHAYVDAWKTATSS